MKRLRLMAMMTGAAISLLPSGQADPNGAFVGALAGAGAGLVLANNVEGVHREWAVPVLAIGGGILGREMERHSRCWDVHRCPLCARGRGPWRHAPVQSVTPSAPNLQPGVDLIKVSILNSNGVRTDVNLLRVKDKFVGPQGETYETLPSAETLAAKYGM